MPLSKARDRDRRRIERTGSPHAVQPNQYTLRTPSIQERIDLLWRIATDKGNVKLASPVEATKEINRMTGAYPPTQHLPQKVVFEIEFVPRLKQRAESIEGELIQEGSQDAIQRQREAEGSG